MRISLRSVTKSFGATPALANVSLDIEPGEIVAVLGPNGAGKSTLLRCLIGVAAPDAGEICYDGELFTRERLDFRKRTFFLPDFPLAYPTMSVVRHIDLVLRLYEADRARADERAIALLREFDMLPLIDAAFGTLSRGQAYKGLRRLKRLLPKTQILPVPPGGTTAAISVTSPIKGVPKNQ